MIEAKQIPDEAVDALWKQMGSFFSREEARDAIAVALRAWPWTTHCKFSAISPPTLILPLKEPRT
jgi:hypothetical protein